MCSTNNAHTSTYAQMGPATKKSAVRIFLGKYLGFQGGDF